MSLHIHINSQHALPHENFNAATHTVTLSIKKPITAGPANNPIRTLHPSPSRASVMAKISPKLIHKTLPSLTTLPKSSSTSTISSPSLNLAGNIEPPPVSSSNLDLTNSETLFSSVSSRELIKSLLNLHLVGHDSLADAGIRVMRSPLMETKLFRGLLMPVIKRTVYDHFCAGENLEEAGATLTRLWGQGLRGILDYGLEDAEDNDGCDENLKEFLKTVDMTSLLPPSSVSFACVKITAICPISLLERVSDLLRWEHKDSSFHLPWKVDTLPILSDSSPVYHTPSKPDPLTETEETDLGLAHQRLEKLCKKCLDHNLPLLVDAEYTSVQPAIDYFTYSASLLFNKNDSPIVYGTIQAYLRDAKERIIQVAKAADSRRLSMGFKLVRGAYITRETQISSSLGVASPIHSCIQDTHACYDSCASFMLEKIARGPGSIVLATHNLESGKAAVEKAKELRIGKGNQKLHFAQLKGMSDSLSLGLKLAGFQVSKYLAFGPVDKVIPYLLRRAEENKGLLSASIVDRQLMRRELKRRFKAATLGVEPDKMMIESQPDH